MNTYKTSDGTRLKQSTIDSRIKNAKSKKISLMQDQFGYVFCEKCGVSNGTFIDCSHDISVKECKETGRTELAFDVNNITMLCRKCHEEKDKLNVQWT